MRSLPARHDGALSSSISVLLFSFCYLLFVVSLVHDEISQQCDWHMDRQLDGLGLRREKERKKSCFGLESWLCDRILSFLMVTLWSPVSVQVSTTMISTCYQLKKKHQGRCLCKQNLNTSVARRKSLPPFISILIEVVIKTPL